MQVLAGSASKPFATALAADMAAPLVDADIRRFPDGEAYVRVLGDVRGTDLAIVQATTPDAHLVEMLLLADAAREAGARRLTAVVPYLGYARQDRAFAPGEAVSSRATLRALASGFDRLVTVDPHKPDVLRFFGDADAATAVPQLAAELARWGIDLVLAPDKGARDRAEAAARLAGVPVDHMEKTRLSATEVRMAAKELDVRGRRVAIVDDLIASGGTMATAALQLKAQGATQVYAACTHGVFTDDAVPRLLGSGIDRLLATDTLPHRPGCHTVSAAPAVAGLLRAQIPPRL